MFDKQWRTLGLTAALAGVGALLMANPALAAEAPKLTLEEVTVNVTAVKSGADTLLMLIGSAMVLLMTPGLAFFYGGFGRAKNVLNIMMMSFLMMGLVGVTWVVYGYSLAFDTSLGSPFIGGFNNLFLNGVGGQFGIDPVWAGDEFLISGMSASSFALFQGMFAIITPALISGALVERVNFKAWFWFGLLWSTFVYIPMAHMVWGGNGLIYAQIGALDFAGGTVVHIASGVGALVSVAMIGPRRTFPNRVSPPHNVPFILLGAGLLWFGWFGFNGASYFAAQGAGLSFITTNASAAAAMLTWLLLEQIEIGKPTAVGAATGAVAGLVGVTPAAGFIPVWASLPIGAITALVCFLFVTKVKGRISLDDSLDAFGVHGVGGTVGAILTGVFAQQGFLVEKAFPTQFKVIAQGPLAMTWAQIQAVLVTYLYVGIATFVIWTILKSVMRVRATDEQELKGLDFALHGEDAYGKER
jgi:Amt family ammonium transporter